MVMQKKKIPLLIAIFMSINIVIGGGFFISANELFGTTGALAPLGWVLCGLLLLPLVMVLAKLSNIYPRAGGLYVYSKEKLGEFWGYLSGWGYFAGTLAGNAAILLAFSSLVKEMGFGLPFTQHLSPLSSELIFNLFFLILFTGLNLMNITILEKLHAGFTILKIIPVGLILIAIFFLFDFKNVMLAPIKPQGLMQSMPTFLFAYLGIEACCSITHRIEDGKRNSAKAMLIALGIIIATYAIAQFGLLGIVGTNYTGNPFFGIIPRFTSNPFVITWGNLTVKLAILSSYLGGFYGMYYANSWNLYAIAEEEKIVGHSLFTKLNKYKTPWVAILAQGFLVLLLVYVSQTNRTTLLTMSGFGVVIAYVLSVISYMKLKKHMNIAIGFLALIGSLALLAACVNDLVADGLQYLLPFLGILLVGVVLYRK